MIVSNPDLLDPAAWQPEVLVVGAGAVGIALTVLLARKGVRVTLLEAGPALPPAGYRANNAAGSTGRQHIGLTDGRMKALGGTTRLWGGQLLPFAAQDLAEGSFAGKRGWPISFDALEQDTRRAYELLGVPAEAQAGLDLFRSATNLEPHFGDDLAIAISTWLPQPDLARLFEKELTSHPAVTLLTGHAVTDLAFAAPGAVSDVIAADGQGGQVRFRPAQVVLANGTFELVHLLQTVAQGHPECGFSANPHLGRWFIDHLHGLAGRIEQIDKRRIGRIFDPIFRHGRKFSVKLRASDALREREKICNVAAMVLAPMGFLEAIEDLRSLARRLFSGKQVAGSMLAAFRQLAVLAPVVWRYVVRRRAGGLIGSWANLGIEVEQIACQQSCIASDPESPGGFALHWEIDGGEMRAIRAFALAIRDWFAAEGLGRVVLDPRIEAGDPGFLDSCQDAYHQMGGARMAMKPEDGVVDPDLKLFGTANLYALGAATFPSGSFANPTLTAIALAVRLGDHLCGNRAQ
jgi:choline dehydrogenase-like flavoprotein